ncbi:CGNR zinc finger domain-containing protein [Streptomyces sp. NPDC087420]|uniref:CGNR zinc finger domain-containing protein n=1 Tax=Streptomyces sp. NPDC087420 TaxID=3365785 RepID=UPI003835194D
MDDVVVDLGVVEQFLNTLDRRTFSWHGENFVPSDALTSVEDLSAWLEKRGLATAGLELRPSDLAAAVALRGALREALTDGGNGYGYGEGGGYGEGDSDGTAVAQALAAFPLRLAPDPTSGRLRIAAASGVAGLDAIVETVASSVAGGGWNRMKLCSSADCRRAFYDTSRNGGGRWCTMKACGNRNKTRAYRSRQAG